MFLNKDPQPIDSHGENGYTSIFRLYEQKNLCHLRMTPLRTILQHVNDTPYTTPAKRGLKIDSRAYCRALIFSRPLLRTIL